MLEVTLTREELLIAANAGAVRRIEGILRKRRDYFQQGDRWERDIVGAMAEMAVAKGRGSYWTGLGDHTVAADVGTRAQVRSSTRRDASLTIYPPDDDSQAFVLVTCEIPVFRIVGWVWGREAKQEKFWRAFENNRHGGAWMVPQAALRSVE